MENPNPLIGTCSWNYDSWTGLVYSKRSPTAAGYLQEYAKRFRTVEIDSWFYRIPERRDVLEYLSMVDDGFRFTCKVPQDICLTHRRNRGNGRDLVPNPDFLSRDLFARFLDAIEPMIPRLDAIMLEFEHLNRQKMASLEALLEALDDFASGTAPRLPLAVEVRNGEYLTGGYFEFLRARNWQHVFSEKRYMPPVYEVYESCAELLGDATVIRLLGGDRQAMEQLTSERWDRIVAPKEDKASVVDMTRKITLQGKRVIININNHYEGSAPLTAAYFEGVFGPGKSG